MAVEALPAVTLHNPWAALIANWRPGFGKDIETRSWATKYRGWIAIHAALRTDVEAWRSQPAIVSALADCGITTDNWTGITIGQRAIVAVARVVAVEPTAVVVRHRHFIIRPDEHFPDGHIWDVQQNHPFGDFSPGRFAWFLTDIEKVPVRIEARGYQGMWNATAHIPAIQRAFADHYDVVHPDWKI